MKINNIGIFMGDTFSNHRNETIVAEEKKNNSAVFAGEFHQKLDPIAQKKQKAKEQAMKIVGDAFDGDRKIDKDMEARREKIRLLQDDIRKAKAEVNDMEKMRDELKEVYGVPEGSIEEQELALLEKEADAKMSWKKIFLTKEEREELARIKADGLTEYQQRSMEMKEYSAYYERQIYDMDMQIKEEDAIIRSTKLERLKNNPMVKAEKQADAVMEAASEDIVSMLLEDAKEHIDEEMEEKKEAAETAEEEKEELEEKLERAKERKEEQRELTELMTESTQQMIDMDTVKDEVQDEVQKMLDKMKLLEEDIKGAAVDEVL